MIQFWPLVKLSIMHNYALNKIYCIQYNKHITKISTCQQKYFGFVSVETTHILGLFFYLFYQKILYWEQSYGCLATFRRYILILACKGGPAKLGEKCEFHVWNLP